MKNKINLSLNDLCTIIYFYHNLSDYEFLTFVKFLKEHKSLSIDEKYKLLSDEFPELYDKLLIIGGNLINGSTTV